MKELWFWPAGEFSRLTPGLGDGQWRERVIHKSRERVKFSQLLLKVLRQIFWSWLPACGGQALRLNLKQLRASWNMEDTSLCHAFPLWPSHFHPCCTSFCPTFLFGDLLASPFHTVQLMTTSFKANFLKLIWHWKDSLQYLGIFFSFSVRQMLCERHFVTDKIWILKPP